MYLGKKDPSFCRDINTSIRSLLSIYMYEIVKLNKEYSVGYLVINIKSDMFLFIIIYDTDLNSNIS